MAISPGTYNFTVQRRSDHNVTLQFKDSTDAAINLTGWTVAAQAWDKSRTTKYADFSVTYIDRITGKVSIGLSSSQSATFPTNMYYDVLLTDPSDFKEYYLEGLISVSEGYTA